MVSDIDPDIHKFNTRADIAGNYNIPKTRTEKCKQAFSNLKQKCGIIYRALLKGFTQSRLFKKI